MAPTLVLSFQNLIQTVNASIYFSQSGLPINTILSVDARERRAPGKSDWLWRIQKTDVVYGRQRNQDDSPVRGRSH